MLNISIRKIQRSLREEKLDGWLFYDFRGCDPIAYRILGLDFHGHFTRRWFYYIPAKGSPAALVHRIEPHGLNSLPGKKFFYVSFDDLKSQLAQIFQSPPRPFGWRERKTIAAQYSPQSAVPTISRLDAGIVELVRNLGIRVASSGDLIQYFEAVLSPAEVRSHKKAAGLLYQITQETFWKTAKDIRAGKKVTEYNLQQFIVKRFEQLGLIADHPPIVAVNQHTALPHYSPSVADASLVTRNSLLLIDLWAKLRGPGNIYADITWTAYAGDRVSERYQQVFNVVANARDAAIDWINVRWKKREKIFGFQADRISRKVIEKAGYAPYFIHRTGHSIGQEVHGNGANIDSYETYEQRKLLPNTCFSIEPGIYLPGKFGIRSEVDVHLSEGGASATTPLQKFIVPLLA